MSVARILNTNFKYQTPDAVYIFEVQNGIALRFSLVSQMRRDFCAVCLNMPKFIDNNLHMFLAIKWVKDVLNIMSSWLQ